jgi:hypothetical protein
MKNILLALSIMTFMGNFAVIHANQPVQTKTQATDPKTADLHTLVGRTVKGTLFTSFTALSAFVGLGVLKLADTSDNIAMFKAFHLRLFGSITLALGSYASYNWCLAYKAYQRLKKSN